MEKALQDLTSVLNARFAGYLRLLPGETPAHEVAFSRRITTSWALIYYRRHLVRLSPYLFLLDPGQLRHGSHWRELDATLRHEAVHAHLFAQEGETGHPPKFQRILAQLGVQPNGSCDRGPENVAYRYRYACLQCGTDWPRRTPLKGNWSCGECAPGTYEPRYRMQLVDRHCPWTRMRTRREWVSQALEEARASPPPREVAPLLSAR